MPPRLPTLAPYVPGSSAVPNFVQNMLSERKRPKQSRNRQINSCVECRIAKQRCDKARDRCGRCIIKQLDCLYLDNADNALINGHKHMSAALEQDVRNKAAQMRRLQLEQAADEEEPEDYEDLEVLPFTTEVASYDDDADTESTDLGCRLGKCQITDRIGGQFRPRMAEELELILKKTESQPELSQEKAQLAAPPAYFASEITTPTASFLSPSPSYLEPNLNLFSSTQPNVLKDCVPPFPIASRILEQYWLCVHPIARVLHRPSFEARWQHFWNDLRSSRRPAASLEALVLAVLFSGLATMPDDALVSAFGQDKGLWMKKLQSATENALCLAKPFHATKVESLQAFVAYLVLLCRAEVSRAHSSLVAAAIRIAQCNGLHGDGEQRGYNPVETHVRRLIWFNLCFLDIRTTEAQGPWPIIRPGDYTTKFPSNLDDAVIEKNGTPLEDAETWTEMTVPLIRFRCNEFHRDIWIWRRQLDQKEVTITSVIKSIESFRAEWSMKYIPSDEDVLIQRYGRALLEMLIARIYGMVLHKYHLHPSMEMPDRLKQIMIVNGIKTMDRTMEIETHPDYASWQWYVGALQQHHYALLMVMEVLLNPRRKDSVEIWRGLDYVFEPPNIPPVQKARWIVHELKVKMEYYTGKRQLRAPWELEQKLQQALQLGRPEEQGKRRSSSGSSPTSNSSPDFGSPTRKESLSTEALTGDFTAINSATQTPIAKKNSILHHSKTRRKRISHNPSIRGGHGIPTHEPQAAEKGVLASGQRSRQKIEVDWNELEESFPREVYTGDIDVPFDTWTQQLQDPSFLGNHQYAEEHPASAGGYYDTNSFAPYHPGGTFFQPTSPAYQTTTAMHNPPIAATNAQDQFQYRDAVYTTPQTSPLYNNSWGQPLGSWDEPQQAYDQPFPFHVFPEVQSSHEVRPSQQGYLPQAQHPQHQNPPHHQSFALQQENSVQQRVAEQQHHHNSLPQFPCQPGSSHQHPPTHGSNHTFRLQPPPGPDPKPNPITGHCASRGSG